MKFGKRLFLLLFVTLLTACAPGGAEPELTETAVPTSATNPDIAAYAEDAGISVEEAIERFGLEESIGKLQADLLANEAGSFAGLWLEHEPEYKVVVAFAEEDGAERIRPYLDQYPALAEVVEIRSVQYTMTELEAAQQEVLDIVSQLDPVSMATGIDVKQNQVFLTVGNPELLLEQIVAAGYELPPMVKVEPIDPDNIPSSNSGGLDEYSGPDGQMIYFPRQAPAVAGMDALLEGTLVLDENGCLRVQHESVSLTDAPVVIWHYDFSLEIDGEEIMVLNGDGEPVGQVGEWTRMGGGESRTINEPQMPEACPGPYWILGSIETLAEQSIPDIFPQSANDAVYYYQSKAAVDEATISGNLTIEDGCFQVDGYTIFWPPNIWPDEDAEPLQIVYRKDDVEAAMFTVGEEITLPGSEKTAEDYRFFENKVDCPGPFWGVAALSPN